MSVFGEGNSLGQAGHKTAEIPSRGQQGVVGLSFRQALKLPAPACKQPIDDTTDRIDGELAKTLIDFKFGRLLQSKKRFQSLVAECGFSVETPLIQQDNIDEKTAPLLIFELLFILNENLNPPPDEVWQYFEAVSRFHPDDAICHGAIYNLLMILFLRQTDLSAAEELAKLALTAYHQCQSPYLEGFIHLHLAFIHIYAGRLGRVRQELDAAESCFARTEGTECEDSMVQITKIWVRVEQTGILPKPDDLLPLKDQLVAGGFWPETFLALAALLFRASVENDAPRALEHHSALEAILRVRGMTQLLPAMQLLREEYFAGSRQLKSDRIEPMGLSERQLILLFPTARTIKLNWGEGFLETAVQLPRMKALQELAKADERFNARRFDLAAPHYLTALNLVEEHGWIYLLKNEQQTVERFLGECRRRKRFVEQARHFRNDLLSNLLAPRLVEVSPEELTASEFGVLKHLATATSNKAMARSLDVSEATVKFHLKNIYRKLGVNNRRDAIKTAAAKGWISIAPQSGE